jgi:diguanylate cyclase
VLALLERAKVPPEPPFYKLCYDYVAGVRTLDAMRAGAILDAPQDETRPARERLYDEFVQPYLVDGAVELASGQMIARLQTLEKMIVETQDACRTQSAALAGATAQFSADDLDIKLMREWILRLQAANARMRQTNEALSTELDETRHAFAAAQQEVQKLSRDAVVDALTGIANRSGLDQAMERALDDARQHRNRLALAVVDIDHFKRLNDSYGHQTGDEILRLVARALVTSTRSGDVVGRMGGDEFVVVFSDEDQASAEAAAERIRRAVLDCDLSKVFGEGILGSVTVSIGVAAYRDGDNTALLVERADRCLFDAKHRGRNQVAGETPAFRPEMLPETKPAAKRGGRQSGRKAKAA